jgi:hypothetical protein
LHSPATIYVLFDNETITILPHRRHHQSCA